MAVNHIDTSTIEDGRSIHVPGEFEQHIDFVLPDDDYGRPLSIRENLSIAAIGLTVLAAVIVLTLTCIGLGFFIVGMLS